MDVVSSVGAIVGLVFNFAKAIKTCHDIKGRYDGVDETIASVKDELETLQGALKQLMDLMMNDAAALSSRWDVDKHLPQTFAGAMSGFKRTIAVLLRDLDGLHSAVRDGGKEMGKGKKAAFMWNESGLNGHCVQLRSQAGALHLLLGVLQTGSMSEFKTDLHDLKAAIEKLSLIASNVPDDIPPVYTAQVVPTGHLLDFSDDLMDIEKSYPVMDSPPHIDSEHGEILRRALTPNTTGESSKSRMRGKGKAKEEIVGLGIHRQAASPIACSYLPDRFDEFGPLPKKPLVFKSSNALHRPRVSNDLLDSSDSIPLATPKPRTPTRPPPSTLENLGIIHPSPDPSSKSPKPLPKKPSSSPKVHQTPETLAISQRLSYLRQTASAREQSPEIFRSVLTGNAKLLSNLLNSGQDIESSHPTTNSTPLILAASLGHFEILELLLDKNANTSAIDHLGRSALHYAASENHPECTELLLAYGASPDIEDQEKETPLHIAVRYLRSESVEVLLGWTKNPLKQKNARGQTALHLAARNRGVSIIEKICERAKKVDHIAACSDSNSCACPVIYQGADVEDDSGDTALQTALFRRSMEAVSLLLKYTPHGANAPQRTKHWSNGKLEGDKLEWERPLHYAVRGSSKTLVKRLLDAGADGGLKNSEGKTALIVAVERENFAGARSLLSQDILVRSLISEVVGLTDSVFEEVFAGDEKIDFGVETSVWWDLLVEVCRKENWEKVCCLLRKAENKAQIGKILDDERALEKVILGCEERKRSEVVANLLSHGANINTKFHGMNGYWEHALHLTAEKNDIPLIDVLLKNGANLEEVNSEGLVPFHIAVLKGNISTISYLLAKTSSRELLEEASVIACIMGEMSRIELVLPSPPPIEALHMSICSGRIDLTRFLLERGCDPLGVGEDGKMASQIEYDADTKMIVDDKFLKKPSRRDFQRCKELVQEAVERKQGGVQVRVVGMGVECI